MKGIFLKNKMYAMASKCVCPLKIFLDLFCSHRLWYMSSVDHLTWSALWSYM